MLHMEQKDYKLEIVNQLMKKNSHVRALSKEVKTNHMTVSRKINALLAENAVDFRKEGKNKVFFLKKTDEARAYVIMSENYKLLQLLTKYSNLRGLVNKIRKTGGIKVAVLFGSYAKGSAGPNSDIDIYIDTKSRGLKKELEALDSKLSVKIGPYDKGSLLIKEIEKNHIIIKGAELFYEKSKFFD